MMFEMCFYENIVACISIFEIVFLSFRILLSASWRIWKSPRCLGRPERIPTESHGQNQEGELLYALFNKWTWSIYYIWLKPCLWEKIENNSLSSVCLAVLRLKAMLAAYLNNICNLCVFMCLQPFVWTLSVCVSRRQIDVIPVSTKIIILHALLEAVSYLNHTQHILWPLMRPLGV